MIYTCPENIEDVLNYVFRPSMLDPRERLEFSEENFRRYLANSTQTPNHPSKSEVEELRGRYKKMLYHARGISLSADAAINIWRSKNIIPTSIDTNNALTLHIQTCYDCEETYKIHLHRQTDSVMRFNPKKVEDLEPEEILCLLEADALDLYSEEEAATIWNEANGYEA